VPLGDFVQPGTVPNPLAIGRTGRLLFGVGALFYVAWLIFERDALIWTSGIDLGLWIGILFALYYCIGLTFLWSGCPSPGGGGPKPAQSPRSNRLARGAI
jgi:hypothetical protein